MEKERPLLQLYYGRRGNIESVTVEKKYIESLGEAATLEKNIFDKLKSMPELKDLFTKYTDTSTEMNATAMSTHYIEGLSFGILLGLDIAKVL